jgi:hypothetical protein
MEGGFEYMADFKLSNQYNLSTWQGKLVGKTFFSIGAYTVNNDFKVLMHKLYPDKSIYEK